MNPQPLQTPAAMTSTTFPLNSREYHAAKAADQSVAAHRHQLAGDTARATHYAAQAAYHRAEALTARPAQTAPEGLPTTITRADIDAAAVAAAAASGTDAHLDAMKQCVALIRARRAERAAMHTDTEAQRDAFARLAATARPDFMQHYGSARLVADRTAR